MSEKIQKFLPYIVFGVFFVFLCIQFRLIGTQYDDYGYYTLNYAVKTPHNGTQYTFAELIRFLKEHYSGANGRLLIVFLWLTIYKIGGLAAVKIMEAVIVTVIWLLLYYIAIQNIPEEGYYRAVVAVLLCLSYGLIPQTLHQHGTYWHAAFFGYYPMLIPTALFIILYVKYHNNLNWKRVLLLSVLVFLGGWSGETWAVGVGCLTGVLWLKACWDKKGIDLVHLAFVFSATMGIVILMSSPGIKHRLGEKEISLLDINLILDRIGQAFGVFLSDWNKQYILFWGVACCILGVALVIKTKNLFDMACLAISAIVTMFFVVDFALIRDSMGRNRATMTMCVILCIIGYAGVICRYLFIEKNVKEAMLLFTAFMAMASLCGIPEIQFRIYIPFQVCIFLPICNAGFEVLNYIVNNLSGFKDIKAICLMLAATVYCIFFVHYTVTNLYTIYKGYSENKTVYDYNEKQIKEAKTKLDKGEKVERITLVKNKNDEYASVMLYQQIWFKQYVDVYYRIPNDVEYYYE